VEDQLEDLLVAELLPLPHDARLDRLLEDPALVEPAAVVGDVDDDVARLVVRPQFDAARRRLADLLAHVRRFDPVVHAVAHHVHERVADRLHHVAVQLRLAADHLEVDRLAELAAQVAHEAGHLLEDAVDRDHPHRHRQVLQLPGDLAEVRHVPGEALVAGAEDVHVWLTIDCAMTSSPTMLIRLSSRSVATFTTASPPPPLPLLAALAGAAAEGEALKAKRLPRAGPRRPASAVRPRPLAAAAGTLGAATAIASVRRASPPRAWSRRAWSRRAWS
jgi:hypothetical protein